MSSGLKQCIEADSGNLIRNLPQIKLLITQFISIPGQYSPSIQTNLSFRSFFDDPSPTQYAIIQNRPNALQALIDLSCNSKAEEKAEKRGFDLSIDDIFMPKPSSTNCKLPLLNLCVKINNFRCLKILVDFLKANKRSIDTVDRDNRTPLLEAVLTSNSEFALYLLREGADPLFTPNNNVLGRPIMNALFVMPELFVWMVKALIETDRKDKYLPLLSEKYDPKTFQLASNGKTLMEILDNRPELSFSRSALAHVANGKDSPDVFTASEDCRNTLNPQQLQQKDPTVLYCELCQGNPSCGVCARCGKHMCVEHLEKHECK